MAAQGTQVQVRAAETLLSACRQPDEGCIHGVIRADLNRATFYAHYPDVRGVTEEIENEIIAKMLEVLEEFRYTNFFRNPAPLLQLEARELF